MGKFVITRRTNGEFQFHLRATNGEIILSSEGYTSKTSCLNGIESTKHSLQDYSKFDRKTSANGKFYFTIKASNGQILAVSEMYSSETVRDRGIESVRINATDAIIQDLSIV